MKVGVRRKLDCLPHWPGSALKVLHPSKDPVDIESGPADRRVDRDQQCRCGPRGGPALTGAGVVVIDPGRRTIADHGVDGRYLELGFERYWGKPNDGQR